MKDWRVVCLTIVAVALVSAGNANAGEDKRVLSLDDFLAASAKNPAFLERDAAIRRARWQEYRANWAWGPKLESTTLIAPVPANPDPDRFDENLDEILSLNLGLYVRENLRLAIPLYTFGRISIAKDLAALGVDSAILQKQVAGLEVRFQVEQAFYAMQLSRAFDAIFDEGRGMIKEELEKMEEARDFGEADFKIEDLRRLQIFDAEIDTRYLENQQLGAVARDGMVLLTGMEEDFDVAPLDPDSPALALADIESYLTQARQTRPEMKLLDRAVSARALQVAMQRREFFPNLAFVGELGYGWSTEELALRSVCRQIDGTCVPTDDLIALPYSNPLSFFSFRVGVVLQWRFDFWQLRGRYQESIAQQDETLAQQMRALEAIEFEIRKVYQEAAMSYEKLGILQRRLDAARRWRDQFGLAAQAGGGNLKDAIDPLRAYYEARVLLLQARFEYQVARAQLARAVGVDDLAKITVSMNENAE